MGAVLQGGHVGVEAHVNEGGENREGGMGVAMGRAWCKRSEGGEGQVGDDGLHG